MAKKFVATFPQDSFWDWDSQVTQYPPKGRPGIEYFRGNHDGLPIHCLLYRDPEGDIVGILNYYPQDLYEEGQNSVVVIHKGPRNKVEQKGQIKVWTHPDLQRQGIATNLVSEALRVWHVDLYNQITITPQGAKFLNEYLSRHSASNGSHSLLLLMEEKR